MKFARIHVGKGKPLRGPVRRGRHPRGWWTQALLTSQIVREIIREERIAA
jgi:hypothetical protein